MKRRRADACRIDSGFTLIEVIIAIVLMGILGTMAIQFMGSTLTGSSLPIQYIQEGAGRVAIMEKIISDYVVEVNRNNPADALATLKTRADSGDYDSGGTTAAMTWIDFDGSGQEVGGGSDHLKVSVVTGNAGIVTVLSKSRLTASDPKVAF